MIRLLVGFVASFLIYWVAMPLSSYKIGTESFNERLVPAIRQLLARRQKGLV
jgi:hypothetical protein